MNGELDRSWIPRILAPLAFFAAATILVLLVHSSLNAEADEPRSSPETSTRAMRQAQTNPGTITVDGSRRRRFYRIQAGDTLEQIALRFDTTVDDLSRLNPGIDANALTPGQRIRVR